MRERLEQDPALLHRLQPRALQIPDQRLQGVHPMLLQEQIAAAHLLEIVDQPHRFCHSAMQAGGIGDANMHDGIRTHHLADRMQHAYLVGDFVQQSGTDDHVGATVLTDDPIGDILEEPLLHCHFRVICGNHPRRFRKLLRRLGNHPTSDCLLAGCKIMRQQGFQPAADFDDVVRFVFSQAAKCSIAPVPDQYRLEIIV